MIVAVVWTPTRQVCDVRHSRSRREGDSCLVQRSGISGIIGVVILLHVNRCLHNHEATALAKETPVRLDVVQGYATKVAIDLLPCEQLVIGRLKFGVFLRSISELR